MGQVHGRAARGLAQTGKLIELEKKWNIQPSAFLKKMHEEYSKKGS